jgi:hypothetical protein
MRCNRGIFLVATGLGSTADLRLLSCAPSFGLLLKQILLNLLKVADGRDWVELAVADTGIGLTTEQQAKAVPGLHSG